MKINAKPHCTPTKSPHDTGSPPNYRQYDDADQNGMSCVYNSESPTGKTILITNYSASPAHASNAASQQKSSITIYTHKPDAEHAAMPTSSINILINNHYDSSLADSTAAGTVGTPTKRASVKVEPVEAADDGGDGEAAAQKMPTMPPLRTGDDVLVQQENGALHLGTVHTVRHDSIAVQFADCQPRWTKAGRVQRLSDVRPAHARAALCIVCKNADDGDGDSVRICCQCQRGFHDKCLATAQGTGGELPNWSCDKCAARANERLAVMDGRRTIRPHRPKKSDHKFAYDIDALTWDVHHRQNHEQIYCYCGQRGKWFMQMLQCVRCQQWFHANCVKCLNAPLYFGDR